VAGFWQLEGLRWLYFLTIAAFQCLQ
jgi:hypothetical protein